MFLYWISNPWKGQIFLKHNCLQKQLLFGLSILKTQLYLWPFFLPQPWAALCHEHPASKASSRWSDPQDRAIGRSSLQPEIQSASSVLPSTPGILWSLLCSPLMAFRSAFSLSLNSSSRSIHGPRSQYFKWFLTAVKAFLKHSNASCQNYGPGCHGLVKWFGLKGIFGGHLNSVSSELVQFSGVSWWTHHISNSVGLGRSPCVETFKIQLDIELHNLLWVTLLDWVS